MTIRCAQRLSASKVLSPAESRKPVSAIIWCSTPFGIKGSFTLGFRCKRVPEQGCSTPFGIKGSFTPIPNTNAAARQRAQRLSASKVLSLSSARKQRFWRRGAQRLSASKVLSLASACTVFPSPICAQRLSASKVLSPTQGLAAGRTPRVLNAFRHQRFFHSSVSGSIVLSSLCSTPFGIKGSFTNSKWSPPILYLCAQRLSASKVLSPT